MNKEVLSTREIVENYIQSCQLKAEYRLSKVVLLGFMAGAFIALGAQAGNVAMHSITDVGLARMAAGMVFPVGLMMIILLGGELFTGDCLLLLGVLDKKITWKKMLHLLVIVFIANFAGALFVSLLVSLSGQWDYSQLGLGAFTYKLAVTKSGITPLRAITSGILCNMLVCGAVLMAVSVKTASAKILAVFFTIMAFVVSGFEHCVANMYYLSAGFLASMQPAYVSRAQKLFALSGSLKISGTISNLCFVTLGNIIGGCLIAIVVYAVKKR